MKTEVRRGRKFVEYVDDSLPVGTFVQEIGAHDVSYQDEQGAWLPADENWETDGLDGFSFRAQRMNHKVRFDSIGAWRWYPRRNVETEYIIINRPRCWLTRTNRWGNLLVNGISREGRDITLTSLRNVTRVIHSSWNGIKTDWILENADAPTRFQQQIDLVGLTEVDGWLYGADGEQVARLTPTIAIDAEGNELPTSTSYENGILEFSADVTGAAYPVTIDPDFAGGTADYGILGTDADYATARSTSASAYGTTALNHRVGQSIWAGKYEIFRMYILFDTSSIGASSTVTQNNLKLTTYTDKSGVDFDIQIVKQDWSSGTREEIYDGCLSGTADDSIFRNTSGISPYTQYTSGNLSTAWVNKTGTTYYSLRSSRDYGANQPAGEEYINLYSANAAEAERRPVLSVTYTAGSNDYTLTCEAGSYSLTGTNADLTVTRHYTLTCEAGSYSLTGTNADLTVKRNYTLSVGGTYPDILVSGAGTSAVNGTYAYGGLNSGKPFYAKGENVLAWIDSLWVIFNVLETNTRYESTEDVATPDLVATWTVGVDGTLPVPTVTIATTYSLTGSDVTLTYTQGAQNFTLACETGSYALTGTNAGLTSARTMALESGSYTLTGTNADFYRALVMACEAGSYALTGSDATFNANYVFALGVGSYALVGTACGLFILSPTPSCRTATIEFENRTFATPHENRTATIEHENRTLEVKCH